MTTPLRLALFIDGQNAYRRARALFFPNRILTPVLGDDVGDLSHLLRRPVARTLHRSPIRVEPVAAPRRALHLDDGLEIHRGNQQRRQRITATGRPVSSHLTTFTAAPHGAVFA